MRKAIIPEGVFKSDLFSPAVQVDDMIYISGTVALDHNGQLVGKDDFRAQAEFVFQSIQKLLAAAHSNMNHLVKVTIYLTDASNYGTLNEVWSKYTDQCQPPPARATVVSNLVIPDLLIEVEAIARTI
ncbi:RidA family protein [Patescibacteria group bacterium AH-259-L07]|nr:RidA family protein [Patescibacteria group bacterium AH-259-L07]